MEVADSGIRELAEYVDSLITIPNDKLLSVLGKDITLLDAFKEANNVLLGAVQGIAELITRPGLINVDFADVRTVMREMGMAMMGTGVAKGENRAHIAAEAAVSSPLLENIDLIGAGGVLVNITAGLDMSIGEFEVVGQVVKSLCSDDATVVIGTVIDPTMKEEMRVTVVLTGLGSDKEAWGTKSERAAEHTKADGTWDYHQLERPTVIRKQKVSQPFIEDIEQDLDIPAFLRRKNTEKD